MFAVLKVKYGADDSEPVYAAVELTPSLQERMKILMQRLEEMQNVPLFSELHQLVFWDGWPTFFQSFPAFEALTDENGVKIEDELLADAVEADGVVIVPTFPEIPDDVLVRDSAGQMVVKSNGVKWLAYEHFNGQPLETEMLYKSVIIGLSSLT